jgi:hypothetical protein
MIWPRNAGPTPCLSIAWYIAVSLSISSTSNSKVAILPTTASNHTSERLFSKTFRAPARRNLHYSDATSLLLLLARCARGADRDCHRVLVLPKLEPNCLAVEVVVGEQAYRKWEIIDKEGSRFDDKVFHLTTYAHGIIVVFGIQSTSMERTSSGDVVMIVEVQKCLFVPHQAEVIRLAYNCPGTAGNHIS